MKTLLMSAWFAAVAVSCGHSQQTPPEGNVKEKEKDPIAKQAMPPKADEKLRVVTERAKFKVGDDYLVRLFERCEQKMFANQGRVERRIWTFYWLDASNLKSKSTRRVWSVYYPWNLSKLTAFRPPEFTFGVRNPSTIGLAYSLGSKGIAVRFYEIDLTKEVKPIVVAYEIDPDAKPYVVPPFDPKVSYVHPSAWLDSIKARNAIPIWTLVRKAYGDKAANVVENSKLQIKEVAWSKDRWRVTARIGETERSFVRPDGETEWELETID